jgi:hypothetical protein
MSQHQGGYLVRRHAGCNRDVDTAYTTLEAAIEAFYMAALNSNPRLVQDGKTLACLGQRLTPCFTDANVQRLYHQMFGGVVLRTYTGDGGQLDEEHPTLEAALAAFAAAPISSDPRVLRDGRTVADLDPEAGLAPLILDPAVLRIYCQVADKCESKANWVRLRRA